MKQKIKITDPKHLMAVGRLLGIAEASEILKAAEEGPLGKLPGFVSARALVDKERAELRGAMVARNLTLAVREGVDVATNNLLLDADGYLIVEQLDD